MMRGYTYGIVALLVLGMTGRGAGEATVSRVDYKGWKQAYRMTNGTVDLIFVPQIGRIMRYGYVNGPNILWENPKLFGKTVEPSQAGKDWTNFGGDKIWPAPQSRWGWPPDPYLDPGKHTAEALPNNHLRVTGIPSKKHGIRFTREIVMDRSGTGVTIVNTMTNVSDKDVSWSLWEVAQVDEPDYAAIPTAKTGAPFLILSDPPPAKSSVQPTGDTVRMTRQKAGGAKIGSTSGANRAYAVKGGLRFTVSAEPTQERDPEFPDDGCHQELWSNPDPDNYMELELLGPVVWFVPGEPIVLTTHWKLERLPRPKR